ncbi:hypothetical protein BKA93DRAFT_776286 [Sparassis latifolia]|uniref:Yeast cell wall synthesis Kre9/Knh1-like N-terminal domain-containing protein n=1 Tax=Sparassis crispa TaxID=139825 RepID=A0A401GZ99_9APHY|nr:hypothetical protein SCP_1101550 [Sparassis crispa]GBE87479.1 hypothetical protein SCP_1101550 [Sparassis crispa]
MKFSVASIASLAALVGGAAAQLEIITPGGPGLWWVAQSLNTLEWTCKTSPYTNFTILIANSNPTILSSPLAILSQQNNYDCSETITQNEAAQPAATGYTIQLADPFNNTNVYATSQPFEIKALGSAYPASSATPSGVGSATSSGATGTSSGSSSASTSTPTSSKSGAVSLTASLSGIAAIAAALGMLMA